VQSRLPKDEFDAGEPDIRVPDLYAELAVITADFPPGRSRTAAPGTGPVAGELDSHDTHMRGSLR